MFNFVGFLRSYFIRTKVAKTDWPAKKNGGKISIIYNKGVSSRSDLVFDENEGENENCISRVRLAVKEDNKIE